MPKSKHSLSFRRNGENRIRKNGVNSGSKTCRPDSIGCRSEGDIDVVVSLEAQIKQQEEELEKRGVMFEEEILQLKNNHRQVVEGMQHKINCLEVSNMRLRQQQINDVGRLKQELRLIRQEQSTIKESSSIEIEKATESIANSCETLKAYVVEEVFESTVSAEDTVKELITELEECRNHNTLLQEKLDSVSVDQSNLKTDANGLKHTAERQIAMSSISSWKDFTIRCREAISNNNGKLPSEQEYKLDEAGMVTVSNLMKELSFNSDTSSCQKTRNSFELIQVQQICEECEDSDEDPFVDAHESYLYLLNIKTV